jgi:hypothetical protein
MRELPIEEELKQVAFEALTRPRNTDIQQGTTYPCLEVRVGQKQLASQMVKEKENEAVEFCLNQ